MSRPSGQAPAGGLGRVVLGTIAFALVAPIAFVTVPLATLLIASRPSAPVEVIASGVAVGYSLWWLIQSGTLPDQVLRAACLIGALVYLWTSLRTRWSFPHRSLLAVGGAVLAVGTGLLLVGSSLAAVRWWVAHQSGIATRHLVGVLWSVAETGADRAAQEAEQVLLGVTRAMAEFFPALTALEILGGLALATALVRRIARRPAPRALERLAEFRFSEHLGWIAVVALGAALLPGLSAARLIALNLLAVLGFLYALRGAAVAAAALGAVGGGGFFLWTVLAAIFLLLMPVVLGGAVLLGVLDAGVDLRRRWQTPRTSA
jgi:hypothetical protein